MQDIALHRVYHTQNPPCGGFRVCRYGVPYRLAHSGTKKWSFFAPLISLHHTHFVRLSCSPRKWECKHSHFARVHCVISRILSGTAIYLALQLLSGSSGSLREISNWCIPQSTALHAGRIFAVAPPMFPLELILAPARMTEAIRSGGDPLASRLGRLCSHPYACARRALPATILHLAMGVSGLSSRHTRKCVGRLPNAER